jgi:acylphosphatase
MAQKRVQVTVSGRVQGVCFRDFTRREAQKFGVTGWVRNLPDGRVEGVFEGEESAVSGLLNSVHVGPPHAQVERVEVEEATPAGEFSSFRVR